jgi:hypothetical protein
VPDGAHHFLGDKEDAAADDGADDNGGGLREAEDALEGLMLALIVGRRGFGCRRGYGIGSEEIVSLE